MPSRRSASEAGCRSKGACHRMGTLSRAQRKTSHSCEGCLRRNPAIRDGYSLPSRPHFLDLLETAALRLRDLCEHEQKAGQAEECVKPECLCRADRWIVV